MAKRIENQKYSITDAFKECFHVVPDYSCEDVWDDSEVMSLLEREVVG